MNIRWIFTNHVIYVQATGSLNYKDINVVSTQEKGDTGRALKSFMIIKKK